MIESLSYNDISLVNRVVSSVPSRSAPVTDVSISDDIILKIPIMAAPMDTVCNGEMALTLANQGGVGIIHRKQTIEKQYEEFLYAAHNTGSPIGVAVGVAGDFKERLEPFLWFVKTNQRAIFICFDTANGATLQMKDAIEYLRSHSFYNPKLIKIIAGNVACGEGYEYLGRVGADMVRVGIGNGSACTTSLVTGIGQGSVNAIQECVARKENFVDPPLIIADGGIKYSGDVAKAIAVGADLVMIGKLLAGCHESPGEITHDGLGNEYKVFRGMASRSVAKELNELNNHQKQIVPEGVEAKVPYTGTVKDFLDEFVGGLKVSMSYMNSMSLDEFKQLFRARPDLIVRRTVLAHSDAMPLGG